MRLFKLATGLLRPLQYRSVVILIHLIDLICTFLKLERHFLHKVFPGGGGIICFGLFEGLEFVCAVEVVLLNEQKLVDHFLVEFLRSCLEVFFHFV